MIIYNIRNNGPYEKDKFLLNVGQLHNLAEDLKEEFSYERKIYKQLEKVNQTIENIYDDKLDSGANQIFLRLTKERMI